MPFKHCILILLTLYMHLKYIQYTLRSPVAHWNKCLIVYTLSPKYLAKVTNHDIDLMLLLLKKFYKFECTCAHWDVGCIHHFSIGNHSKNYPLCFSGLKDKIQIWQGKFDKTQFSHWLVAKIKLYWIIR